MINRIKKFIPRSVFLFFQPTYHWLLAVAGALWYGFPSRHMTIIGVTGTNGKSTVVTMLSKILEDSGVSTASLSSLRFRIQNYEWKNTLKMTMPGRFVLQKFLSDARHDGCTHVVLEVTSEGIKQFRHKGIRFAMAILTNVTPEHIESHGGFEKYVREKAKLFSASPIHVLNKEEHVEAIEKMPAKKKIFYEKNDVANIALKLPGEFNRSNAAAARAAARELGIEDNSIKTSLESITSIPGRLEYVQREPFSVVVDYAHTPDALRKVYEALRILQGKTQMSKLICVLGAAGGGRDKWKRPEFGRIAKEYCDEVILTNEDPYDENPASILKDIEAGFSKSQITNSKLQTNHKFQITNYKTVLDRREAIREALTVAQPGDTVIITGKGAEPWIMGPNGSKTAWDDRKIVREGLEGV